MIFFFQAFRFSKSTVWSLSPLLHIRDLFDPERSRDWALYGNRSGCSSNLPGEAPAYNPGFARRGALGIKRSVAVTSNNAPPFIRSRCHHFQ